MITEPIALYVHIPFCIRKCRYCDFCSYPVGNIGWRREYLNALISEIKDYRGMGLSLKTLFFGGGTPSLLSSSELSEILSAIKEVFDTSPLSEVTLEVNPGTLTEQNARAFINHGINRFSIGLQTIHENELKSLGRIHSFDEFLSSYKLLRGLGADNISIDLMYGIPEQTVESFRQTLAEVISLSPEHVSVYGLILEEGTPIYEQRESLAIPDEDTECDMYELACSLLSEAGYKHYEISNYSREGYRSRHNLVYWRAEEYIGVGVSAHSYFGGKRIANTGNAREYIDSFRSVRTAEVISGQESAKELLMLGLRLSEGFSLSEYEKRFGESFLEGREELIGQYVSLGLMTKSEDRLSLTEKGFYLSNSIIASLI